jgi:hypothetical protein
MSTSELAVLASSVLLAFLCGAGFGAWISAERIEPMEEATMAPQGKRR